MLYQNKENMKNRSIIKSHTMVLEYTCPEGSIRTTITLDNPRIGEGEYYSDWHYKYVVIPKCSVCGNRHEIEIY